MNRSVRVVITDRAHVGAVRREVTGLAQTLGLSQVQRNRAEIIVTEAATNQVKHAGRGEIILRGLGERAMEILAIDKGRGMTDVPQCLSDGYSTAGSAGTGLGAISRLAQVFDVYSEPGQGTIVVAQLHENGKKEPAVPLTTGAVCLPSQDGEPCGDDWCVLASSGRSHALVVDGLGHGMLAAQAADQAVAVFQKHASKRPAELVKTIHGPLKSTRGASLAIAEIDHFNRTIRYSGVGNIASAVVNGESSKSLTSHNGTVGHELHRVQEFQYPWNADATLIMHSDGLLTRWKLTAYPGLLARHPSITAGILYRDYQRGRDDVIVLVARESIPGW